MAPEQHCGTQQGPATDQYAFCVALWEALCGQPPFDAPRPAELLELKLAGPPAWPGGSGVPKWIAAALTRGLAPQPSDRWPTMSALLSAIGHDPRRRHAWAWLGAAGTIAVAGGLVVTSTADRSEPCQGATDRMAGIWDEARRDEVKSAVLATAVPYAADTWARVSAATDDYTDAWVQMHAEACVATTVRGDQSAEVMDLRMACLGRALVDLRAVTGVLAEADADVVRRAHQLVAGFAPLQRCADIERLRADVEPPLAEEIDAVAAARARLAQANAQSDAGRYPAAQDAIAEAKEQLQGVQYGPIQSEVALLEGRVLQRVGQFDEADTRLQDALRSASAWGQRELQRAAAMELMYLLGHRRRRTDAALGYRALAEGLSVGDPLDEVGVETYVAIALMAGGEFEAAEPLFRHALEVRQQLLPPEDPLLANAHQNLANVLNRTGRYAEAEAENREAVALRETALGPDHPDFAAALSNLAIVLHGQGKHEEAEQHARRALKIYVAALGPKHPDVAEARTNVSNALRGQGKGAEAETEQRRALEVWISAYGNDHPLVAGAHNNLAATMFESGRVDDAIAEYRAGIEIMEEALGRDHPDVGLLRINLAGALLSAGRKRDAADEAERAWAINQRDDVPAARGATTAFVLAQALWEAGDVASRPRARELAERARALRTRIEAPDAEEVERWLDEHPLSGATPK